jgi:two-component system cell cycle response regulator
MKVLVIEDDPTQCLLLKRQLERAGHLVFAEQDPYATMEVMWREQIQLMITDWEMPGLNGLDLIRQIREADLPFYVYIIMITGKHERHDVVKGLDAGADDYLVKPFDLREFLARVAVGERIIRLETRLRQANQEMERLVNIDYLTGLLNRRAIYATAQNELERCRRTNQPVSILFLDLDDFKKINDQYGHLVGDEALKAVAKTLQANVRPYDLCGRWAGDEFILILPGVNAQDAGAIAERIRNCIAQIHLPVEEEAVPVSASIGVHVVNVVSSVGDLTTILSQADQALYRAKDKGGAQIEFSKIEEVVS